MIIGSTKQYGHVALIAAMAAIAMVGLGLALPASAAEMPAFPSGASILFIGDSITDGGRGRNADPNHIFGQDYAYIIAANCGAKYPAMNWTFLNRGVSGNKVTDLAARWQTDAIALKPDVVSVLIGINDSTSFVFNQSPVTVDQFEQTYDEILTDSLATNPKLQIVLCQPFILPVGRVKANWAAYSTDIKMRQDAVARLAVKFHAPVVPLQQIFDDAAKIAPSDYWIWDGVHPRAAGHQLIADAWLATYNAFYGRKQ